MDWSPDGRVLLYRTLDPKTGFDLWSLPLDGSRKPNPVLQTRSDESAAQFSPDGRWIAYQSNETGQFEIYVQPFPSLDGKFQISANGGAQPLWQKDGKELFYIGLDDRLMAVPIQLTPDGKTMQFHAPTPLFLTRVGGALQSAGTVQQYAVSPDGERFLMNNVVEGPAPPINIILNWKN
jgi:Tol biopolymer transport system component